MTEDRFWELIAAHVVVDEAREVDLSGLQDALESLAVEEVASFIDVFNRLHYGSYSWELWGAAYVINGGCSDDGFDYFRGWLIAQGRTIFEAAVKDPDSLVEHARPDAECSEILYVGYRAYEAMTGREPPPKTYAYEVGDGWDFDDKDEMKRRYPRLFAKFWDG
jgi:hypothetical protein